MHDSETPLLAYIVSDVTAIFSDIDGTIAHYAKTLDRLGYARIDAAPPAWEEEQRRTEDEVEALLWECFPPSYRSRRFVSSPVQFWLHKDSGRCVKTYELYNLSLTGAVISENTVLLMELLQCSSLLYRNIAAARSVAPVPAVPRLPVVCCLITGARTSTFVRRRHSGSLPQTAFESCEGGSKLWCRLRNPGEWFKGDKVGDSTNAFEDCEGAFYPPQSDEALADADWTNRFRASTGFYVGSTPDGAATHSTSGPTLWHLEAELNEAGFATDHIHYDTSFLIDIRTSPCLRVNFPRDAAHHPTYSKIFEDAAEAEKYLVSRFQESYNELYGVELFVNLGKGQVNAKGSGKRGVMLHVLDRAAEEYRRAVGDNDKESRFCLEKTVALFDDENDLQFAALCGAGILPSVAHDEVLLHRRWTCEQESRSWFRPPIDGLLGSEWALKQIVLLKRRKTMGQ